MMCIKGLQEDDIQNLHTTEPEQLTDQELLLSTISGTDLVRKHSVGWDKNWVYVLKLPVTSPSAYAGPCSDSKKIGNAFSFRDGVALVKVKTSPSCGSTLCGCSSPTRILCMDPVMNVCPGV